MIVYRVKFADFKFYHRFSRWVFFPFFLFHPFFDQFLGTDDRDGTPDGVSGHKGRKQGSQQLKGLQDGLSGYFKATDNERKRKPPSNFTPLSNRHGKPKRSERKSSVKGSGDEDAVASQSDDAEEPEDEDGEEDGEEEEEEGGSEEEEEEEEDDDEEEEGDEDDEVKSQGKIVG